MNQQRSRFPNQPNPMFKALTFLFALSAPLAVSAHATEKKPVAHVTAAPDLRGRLSSTAAERALIQDVTAQLVARFDLAPAQVPVVRLLVRVYLKERAQLVVTQPAAHLPGALAQSRAEFIERVIRLRGKR